MHRSLSDGQTVDTGRIIERRKMMEPGHVPLDLSFDPESIKFKMDVRLWLRNIGRHLLDPLKLLEKLL